jgi:two-component system LytT family response regulator
VPLLIFTTAYDAHALRAFEVNAFDYLLKPIRADRLAAALDKVRAAWAGTSTGHARIAGARRTVADRVFLRDGERCFLVTIGDIACFEGEGNYARVYVAVTGRSSGPRSPRSKRGSIPPCFFRASRKHLLNVRHIEHVDAGIDDSYTVRLKGGLVVPDLAPPVTAVQRTVFNIGGRACFPQGPTVRRIIPFGFLDSPVENRPVPLGADLVPI